MLRLSSGLLMAALMFSTAPARAELSGKDKDEVKKMMAGTLYLRVTIPVRYKSGGFGIGADLLAEVSPSAVDIEKNMPAPSEKRKRGLDTVYWGFPPNTPVGNGKVYFKGKGVVDWWAEGTDSKNNHEFWIHFVGIESAADFKKAFDLVLAPKPLQDEHPEWPEETRKAIAARQVIKGMTKLQAYAVVGDPVGVEKSEEGGKTIETWTPRQDTGTTAAGGWSVVVKSETTGFPSTIRFTDGVVTSVSAAGGKVKLDLGK
jgi:hypothetical protein